MDSKSKWFLGYLVFGLSVCLWFGFAAAYSWRAPDFGIVNGMNSGGGGVYGRSYGGSWGGGK
ncbi:hypothetical protein OAE21_01475 [Rubripirellula sp.]|jgi:hypothetical protein|nr:hypothetical protein [Rubripirellula sp.]MDA7893816.1 hypothetical protein [bacterium]MDB4533019.1 hypothetical protein [bacterium]MDB4624723.1 hypothetical protein [Rubripirellula sp.]